MTSIVGAGAGTNPVPERDMVCTLPFRASLVRVNAPARDPAAVGVNTTFTTQLAPGATDDPQLFDWEKSPDIEMELMFNDILPPFVMVTEEAVELAPTVVVPNVKLAGEKFAVEEPLEPPMATLC